MDLKTKEIKLKRPNNKYMKAYVKAVEKGYSELRRRESSNKNSSKKK